MKTVTHYPDDGSEYTCKIIVGPKPKRLKPYKWVIDFQDVRVESFSMKKGKKVPNGIIDTTYRCVMTKRIKRKKGQFP